MKMEDNTTFLTAGEAYVQATSNKWQQARKHLAKVIVKINKAIEKGQFSITYESDYCTETDIQFLENHGYKFEKQAEKGYGTYYDKISWDLKENKENDTDEI